MKYENEMFQDLMGIVIETDDAWLNKKLNNHVCYKGGGRSSSTPSIPTEFKPFAQEYARQLTSAARFGKFGKIGKEAQPLQEAQRAALARAGDIRGIGEAGIQAQQQALRGEGLFGARDLSAQQAALGAQAQRQLGLANVGRQAQAAMGGGAGGARAALAQREAEAQAGTQLAGRLAELDAEDLAQRRAASAAARGETAAMQKAGMADVDIFRGVGKEQTARAQMMAEQGVRGLKEMGSIFTGIPMGSTTRQSGGK